MGDNLTIQDDTEQPWITVGSRRKKHPAEQLNHHPPPPGMERPLSTKIEEPCWFFNNGGCRHKDSTEKSADECKYLHVYSENVRRPPHLAARKPCDRFNLEGECRWHNNCKYSHRNLTPEEWSIYYPGIPYTLRTNVQKRLQIENNVTDIEGRIGIVEFKQDGMNRDMQQIGQTLQEVVRQLQKVVHDFSKIVNKELR